MLPGERGGQPGGVGGEVKGVVGSPSGAPSRLSALFAFLKTCGTRPTHRRWFNWDPAGVLCAAFVYIIDIGCFISSVVSVSSGSASVEREREQNAALGWKGR